LYLTYIITHRYPEARMGGPFSGYGIYDKRTDMK